MAGHYPPGNYYNNYQPPVMVQQTSNAQMQRRYVNGAVEVYRPRPLIPKFFEIAYRDLRWSTPNKRLKHGQKVRAKNYRQFLWSTWDAFIDTDPFIYMFAIRNVSSKGEYLFISGSKDRKLRLTSEGEPPLQTPTVPNDSRLFRHFVIPHSGKRALLHLTTGLYVTLQSTKRGHKLELTANPELAYDWQLHRVS